MNILVICQYYYPEEFQINDICEELVKQGHKVTVLTGLPNYPTGIIPKEYLNGNRRCEIVNGVEIIRCYEKPRKKGIMGLGFNYVSYCISASLKALTLHGYYDVVFVYQLSPVLIAIPGIIYKLKNNKKMYLYCCDLWPDSIKILGVKEESIIYKIIDKVSKYIYRSADIIGVQSGAFQDYFKRVHFIDKTRMVYIPQFATDEYSSDYSNMLHEGFNFVFLGNVGLIQDLECVVKAVASIKDQRIFKVHIVGDGSFLSTLKKMVTDKGLDEYFVFYGRKPVKDMPIYYQIADVCLLTLKGDSNVGMTIPSKLQGYMAAGKPVLAAINGSAKEIIKDSECGISVCGAGFGLFQSPNNSILIASAPPERSGSASGMLATARLIGQTTGAALMALLFHIVPDDSTHTALLLAGGVALTGAVVSLTRIRLPLPEGLARQKK